MWKIKKKKQPKKIQGTVVWVSDVADGPFAEFIVANRFCFVP